MAYFSEGHPVTIARGTHPEDWVMLLTLHDAKSTMDQIYSPDKRQLVSGLSVGLQSTSLNGTEACRGS